MKYLDVRYYAYNVADLKYKTENEKGKLFSHQQRYEVYYGLQILFTSIFQTLIMLFMGLILGILKEIIITMVAFASLRFFAGGLHANSRRACTITSSLIMLFCVYVGIFIDNPIPLLIIAFILILIFSPTDHFNKPIISDKWRKYNKRMSIWVFILWCEIIYLYPTLSGIITVALFLECLSLIRIPAQVSNKNIQEENA